jgi:hypothetical protein
LCETINGWRGSVTAESTKIHEADIVKKHQENVWALIRALRAEADAGCKQREGEEKETEAHVSTSSNSYEILEILGA